MIGEKAEYMGAGSEGLQETGEFLFRLFCFNAIESHGGECVGCHNLILGGRESEWIRVT